ncbi:hypothetical protein K8R47_03640 [archaeon]|nr:hypothetical protein [archaeon]
MESIFQFLKKLYLPGYMGLLTENYNQKSAVFDFAPTEPPVTILSTEYFTPRGAHIFISQAGFCLMEHILKTEKFDMNIEDYRDLTMQGRMKIIELNQRYRKELKLDDYLQGKLNLTKIRWGKRPLVKIDFDISNRSITGNLTCILAPEPIIPINADICRGIKSRRNS